ncbi:helix-turn-helix transcriptional regulator [Microbacterium immunditiarum]|uniref:DNA-binding CsgD family transcriptional regulator n=1 Tax=Microbacterium immunditiarum TaxID=337480 RepID=A0A7Y9KJ96_9MICO|nr:LuxR family transcriptional regulator [Microbacterium immunditiarum]NYE19416.1 DNA-binding CsgD family transcriptional regulator [Microbacterium immunditiarum]
MTSALAIGRARSDIDVISRAGLPLHHFMDEAAAALQSAVPFVAACVSTIDPATTMVSSSRKIGELDGRNEQDLRWSQIEYGSDDPTSITAIVAAGQIAVGVQRVTHGVLDRSVRMSELIVPHFDFRDEARAVFSDRNGAWGHISLFRGDDDPAFAVEELDLLAAVAPAFTRGIRTGLLAQSSRTDAATDAGPAVMVFDAQDRIVQSTPGAQAHLAQMSSVPGMGDPLTSVQALVSGARRFARGEIERMPRIRARTYDGVWVVLHASPLGGAGDRAGDVVVTIEEARPQEVIDIVAAAFGLTARERDVVAIVLRGADTREIAAELHLSPYTVQDHLKSIFDKAGVASRRELVARVYFDQYLPRRGEGIGPSGWYAGGG